MNTEKPFECLSVGNKKIAFVMAATAEYGPNLRQLFSPLITGVGPVESAISVSVMLCERARSSTLPDLVVCLGSAGSRQLHQAEVYQVNKVSYRDMDASPLGFKKGATPFLDQPATIPLPFSLEDIESASLSTGANIVSGNDYDEIESDMVDMETFAVMRVCQNFGVPLIGLRGISDGKQELSKISDWTQYLHVIDERLAQAVTKMIHEVKIGKISL